MKYEFSTNTIHGIGCIATENIKKGDIVGKEPYFIVKTNNLHKELRDYYWKGPRFTHLLINGLGSYGNHSNDHNMKPLVKEAITQSASLITFIAIRDIQKGEELFNNYGPSYFKLRNIPIITDGEVIKKKLTTPPVIPKKNYTQSGNPNYRLGRMFKT